MTASNQAIKFRLVGALVVLLSFVLAWWLFLDHDVKRYQTTKQNIPEPMQIERFDIAEPTPVIEPMAVAEVDKTAAKPAPVKQPSTAASQPPKAKAVEQSKEVEQPKVVEKTPEKAKAPSVFVQKNEQDLVEAWVVQAGSFGDAENAKLLQQKLLAKSLPAYVKRFKVKDKTYHRVLIGPKLSRAHAEKILPQLKKDFQLDGQILRFQAGFEE